MEFSEALSKVWRDIQESGIPETVWASALTAGLDFYGAGSREATGEVGPQGSRMERVKIGVSTGGGDSPQARLAAETGADLDAVEELFYFDAAGSPGLNGGARKLGKTNAERTRAVALLIGAARHFANDEIEVPVDIVRELCKSYGIYDQNNFASYLADVPGFTLSGPRSERVLRAKSDAAAKFAQKVSELFGGRD